MPTAFAYARPGRVGQGRTVSYPLSSARDVTITREPVRRRVIGLLQALHSDQTASDPRDGIVEGVQFKSTVPWRDDADARAVTGHLERTLKATAYALNAGLIGGGNVTRLERMIQAKHPRITYREALAILGRRGFGLQLGDLLNSGAAACLTYRCGNLPVQVTHCPDESIAYLLPFVGEAARASIRPTAPASLSERDTHLLDVQVHIERLVDYFLAADRRSVSSD